MGWIYFQQNLYIMSNGDGDHRDAAVQRDDSDDSGYEVGHSEKGIELVDLYRVTLHRGHHRCRHCDAIQVSNGKYCSSDLPIAHYNKLYRMLLSGPWWCCCSQRLCFLHQRSKFDSH